MTQTCTDPDPYAELDNRADAFELSEEFRKPIRIQRGCVAAPRMTSTQLSGARRRIPV
ncbi:hypothetical protein [Devosia sp. Naph2]|uniref:hypothetical protein n=1 Tax=Devosia polycyclovorans TaxID=3345148 RepID=UPI0035D0773E